MDKCLLSVKNLKVIYEERAQYLEVVRGVTLEIAQGECLGIVGESGCGKSTLLKSLVGLLSKQGKITEGNIYWKNFDLRLLKANEWQKIRGLEIGMIFQDSMTALNPIRTIGSQMVETFIERLELSRSDATLLALRLLLKVELDAPEQIMKKYPFQLSGGMKQRVMIALNLGLKPKMLIADEPTSSLDVTVQNHILKLLNGIRKESEMSIIITSHHLGVIRYMADKVIVMYAGKIVEKGTVAQVLDHGKHPYTKGLMAAIPKLNQRKKALKGIQGGAPSFYDIQAGCAFYPRCTNRIELCKKEDPTLQTLVDGREVACHVVNEHSISE